MRMNAMRNVSLAQFSGILAVVAIVTLPMAVNAADQTLTYAAGDASLGGGVVEFTYDGDSKITKIVSNVAKGDTVTVTGDQLNFGAGAMVETAGLGDLVLKNAISGTDGLLVTNTSSAQLTMAWWGDDLLDTNSWTTVFANVDLDDIELVSSDENTWNSIHSAGLSNPQVMYPFWIKTNTVDGVKTMTTQLQCYNKAKKPSSDFDVVVKYVGLELKQDGADIAARVTTAGYVPTNRTFSIAYVNTSIYQDDMEVLRARWLADPDPAVNPMFKETPVKLPGSTGYGYGVGQLTVRRRDVPSVSFHYTASRTFNFGGDLKIAANARARRLRTNSYNPASGDASVVDVDGIWEMGDYVGSQGTPIKGSGTVGVVAETLPHENPYEGRIKNFLTYRTNHVNTATANGNLALSHSIFDLTNICPSIMCGGSMTLNAPSMANPAVPCHWRFYTNGTVSYATVQMQGSNSTTMIRCTILRFMQNKPDSFNFSVCAITNFACYTPLQSGANKGDGYFGMDFEDPNVVNMKGFYNLYNVNGNTTAASPFSISNLVCQFSRPGEYSMTINGENPNWKNGRLVVEGKPDGTRIFANANGSNRLPTNGVVEVRMGGTFNMGNGSNGPDKTSQNNSVHYKVYRGGILRTYPSVLTSGSKWAYRKGQRIDLFGGELLPSWMHYPATKLCYVYLNNTIFADGARVESDIPFWVGNAGSSEAGRWLVRGTSPSSIDSPVQFLDTNHAYGEFPIDVADVTGDDGSDFYLLKDFTYCDKTSAGSSSDFDKVELGKYGQGTLEARGKHQLQKGYKINIYGGAWKLGASHITDDAAQGFKLCGGTLEAADGTENNCGPLAITDRLGAIKLGAGAKLTFADSSGETWPTGKTKKVTVYGFEEGAIRFDTTTARVPRPRMFVTEDGSSLWVADDGNLTQRDFGARIIIR